MGSHYSQCFASHQTIAPGDKCYALAIRQQSTYDTVRMKFGRKQYEELGISHGALYPDAYWTPVGNFIEGVYQENGNIGILDTDENIRRLLVFVRLMLENAAVIAEGDNPSHDHPFNLRKYLAESAPVLNRYLKQAPTTDATLSDGQAEALFKDLVGVWEHVDDIAFQHRMFYADYSKRMRPLQFTLMHQRCYDDLLMQVKEPYSPATLCEQGLAEAAATKSLKGVREAPGVPSDMRDLYASMAARSFTFRISRIGTFDDIDYNEEELGFGEFVLRHLEGKLSKAELFKRTVRVVQDRLVIHLLENYKIKLAPKSIWHEDSKNEFGRAYAEFISRVSASVTKGRRNKRKT